MLPHQEKEHEGNEQEDEENLSSGLLRLHRVLSHSAQRRRSSYDTALKTALKEVEQNENVSEQDILQKLLDDGTFNDDRKSKSAWSAIANRIQNPDASIGNRNYERSLSQNDAFTGSVSFAKPTITFTVTPDITADCAKSQADRFDHSNTTPDRESSPGQDATVENTSYHKLHAIARALSNSGQARIGAIQGALEYENLQSGLDKLFTHVMHTFHDQWSRLFEYLVPWQQLHAMLLIFSVQLINVQQVIKLAPVFSCYVSFFVMIYYTLKMIHSRYWTKQAKLWRRLLKVFQFTSKSSTSSKTPSLRGSLPKRESTNDMDGPYGHFFLALLLFVFSFSLADRRTMPNVFPMCALSVFFSFACFNSLLDKQHYFWARGILAADAVSSFPFVLKRLFRWRLHIAFDNVVSFRIGALKLGLGLSSLAVVFVILLYAYVVCFNKTSDPVGSFILPHLVCFAWLHVGLELAVAWNCSFEWRHAIMAGVIIWVILFPSWKAGAACALVAAVQVQAVMSPFDGLKIVSVGLIFCLPYAYKRLVKRLRETGHWSESFWKAHQWKVIFVYIGLAVMLAAVLYGGRESPDVLKRTISNLTWTEFYQQCSSFNSTRHKGNLLQQQIACSEFGSTVIEWSGVVETVRIVNIENFLESIFYYLPDEIAQNLRCLYGSKADAFNGTTSTRKRCSVAQYNAYTFELELRGPWTREKTDEGKWIEKIGSGVAIAEASDVFEAISLDLQRGDVINFTAILDDDILNYPPKLSLLQIECMKCPQVLANQRATRVVSEAFYSEDHWFWRKLYNASRFVFNFICAPLLSID